VTALLAIVALAACGDEAGGVIVDDGRCAPSATAPNVTTYHVAIARSGADDEACDGLAPRDEGGGRCPFRTLRAVVARRLLEGARAVRVELGAGTYLVEDWDGLRVDGVGVSEAERVVLGARAGERVVLDVPRPDGVGCDEASAPETPGCVRQVVLVTGAFTTVEGLEIHNGLGYHVEIRGARDHVLRCNTIGETAAFASRSDLVKVDGGATRVRIEDNELSAFRSQAIDVTGSSEVVIARNVFHDPIDADGGAVGMKYGARRITVADNTVRAVCPGGEGVVFSLGGTSSAHDDDAEAYSIVVRDNRVSASPCKVAQLVSCRGCRFEGNDLDDVGAGVLLSAAATGDPACAAGASGCAPNAGASIRANRFRGLHGNHDPRVADIFVVADPGEREGLDVGGNTYCVGEGGAPRFGLDGALIDLATWVAATGDDSSVQDRATVECTPRWTR